MKNEKCLSSSELKFVGRAKDPFTKVLKKHMELHEGLTLFDLLKFLYQSSLGPFHLFDLVNESRMLDWIKKNLEKTRPSDGPLIEELYGKKWVRLNFGAYKKKYGNDYQKIYEAFAKARNAEQGGPEEFKELLKKLVDALDEGKIQSVSRKPRALSLFKDFLKEYEEQDCPPVHHSKTYMLKNSSDYLVVPRSSLVEMEQPTRAQSEK